MSQMNALLFTIVKKISKQNILVVFGILPEIYQQLDNKHLSWKACSV